MEFYREQLDFPTVLYSQGKLGIINVDFDDSDSCRVTCTNDSWETFEQDFFYVYERGKHFFLSK